VLEKELESLILRYTNLKSKHEEELCEMEDINKRYLITPYHAKKNSKNYLQALKPSKFSLFTLRITVLVFHPCLSET
jgi:hypothetical protein